MEGLIMKDNNVVIEVIKVSKTFIRGFPKRKKIRALEGVSLEVRKGEIFGLLGPNGAGKTTLLNILSTLLLPDEGTARILGRDIFHDHYKIRNRLNMSSGNPNFPWSFTVEEILYFYGMLYGLRRKELKEKIENCIEWFGLHDFRKKRFDELSTGTKQKISLAKSLLNEPEVLFLDEPTVGLDPDIAYKIRNLILNLHREKNMTIILTTHYMHEAEMMCGRIAFINKGKIIASGTIDGLKAQIGAKNLEEVFLELVKQDISLRV
ncbi:MAG: ABC transporter ATP-binding protein [Candidatus Aminicenantia bacterium]